MEREGVADVLGEAVARLEALETFDTEAVEGALRAMLADLEIGARKGLQPIRVAVTGSTISPPLFESIAALGKRRTLDRIAAVGDRLA